MSDTTSQPEALWYTRCPTPTAATIAVWQGFLDDEFAPDGIEIRSLASATDPEVRESHYHNRQPNTFRFGGYVPPLLSVSRGTDVRIIGLGLVDRPAGVFVLPESDIQTVEGLRGKRLGVPLRVKDSVDWWRATVMAGYETALKVAGLGWGDVIPTDVRIDRAYFEDAQMISAGGQSLWGARSQFAVQREEAAALLRGEVDAIYTDASIGALIRSFLGLREVIRLDGRADTTSNYPYCLILTVSGTLLDERPDLVERWVSALLKAGDWAKENQKTTKQLVARDAGLPEELVSMAYSDRVHETLDISLDPDRVRCLQDKVDLLQAHGFLDGPVDLSLVVDPRPLNAARAALGKG